MTRITRKRKVIIATLGRDVERICKLDQQLALPALHLPPDTKPLIRSAGKAKEVVIVGIIVLANAAGTATNVLERAGKFLQAIQRVRIADRRRLIR
jgi:hypothetical protein